MARIRSNLVVTELTEAISDTDTVFTVAVVPEILQVGLDYAVFNIEDEIVYLVGYNTGTSEVTVTRGEEGTTAVAHDSGVGMTHVLTSYDVGKTGYAGGAMYWVSDQPTGAYGETWVSAGVTASEVTDTSAQSYLTPIGAAVSVSGAATTGDYGGMNFTSIPKRAVPFGAPSPPLGADFRARVWYKATTDSGSEVRISTAPNGGGTETVLADSATYRWSDWVTLDTDPEMWGFSVRLYATGTTTTPTLRIAGIQVTDAGEIVNPIPDAVVTDFRGGTWTYKIDEDWSGSGRWVGERVDCSTTSGQVEHTVASYTGLTDSVWERRLFGGRASADNPLFWVAQMDDGESPMIVLPAGDYDVRVGGEFMSVGSAGSQVSTGLLHYVGSSMSSSFSGATWSGVIPTVSGWELVIGDTPVRVRTEGETVLAPEIRATWAAGTEPEWQWLGVLVDRYTVRDLHFTAGSVPNVTSALVLTSPVSGQISIGLTSIDVGTRVRAEAFAVSDLLTLAGSVETTSTTTSITGLSAGPHVVVVNGLITSSEGYSARRRVRSASCMVGLVTVT